MTLRRQFAILGWLAILAGCARKPAVLCTGFTDFRPYTAIDENGRPSGLAVEVIRKAAERAGVQVEWIRKDDPETALRRGEIDLYPIFTVTADRKREFHMSQPWWEYSQLLLSRADKPLRTAAQTAGHRILVRDLKSTVQTAESVLPGAFLAKTSDVPGMVGQVCTGKVDGAVIEGRLLHAALLEQPAVCRGHSLESRPLAGTEAEMASASTRRASAAADRIFDEIQGMIAEGVVTEIANQWFFMPQQHLVRRRLLELQRWYLGIAYLAVSILLFLSVRYWLRARGQKRAAEAAWARARETERRFDTFMAYSPMAALLKDASGRILYANPAFEAAHGLAPGSAVDRLEQDIWPPEMIHEFRVHDQAVLGGVTSAQYLSREAGPDGSVRQWLVLKFRVVPDSGAPMIGIHGIDITEQQRAAELVRQSEERFRLLFDQAPLAMHEIDEDGIVRRVNHAECQLFGLQPDEILGRHASDFATPGQREESRTSVAAKLAGIKPLVPFERTYARKDGSQLTVEVHESPILSAGGAILGIRSCLVDLTERYESRKRLDEFAGQLQEKNAALAMALEAANEATRLKSQFLANMSHEIRTPLNGILGMTELLLVSELTAEQCSLARAVSESGGHLLEIINDILDFSKIEAGKMALEIVPFDLGEVLEGAVGLMAPGAHAKGVELICDIEPGVPRRVYGDPARLRQVLLNLVNNGVKFTASGHVAVLVSGGRRSGAERLRLSFSVVDTGIGIPPAALDGLFSAFTQADSTTTRRFGGTGLGLAIARRIVEQMGGEMGGTSHEGKGSTFWFNLEMRYDPAIADLVPAPHLRGRRLLILDDHALARNVVAKHVESWGMRPALAANIEEARDVLRTAREENDRFELALVDATLPGVDAQEFSRLLRECALFSKVQVIVATPVGVPAPAGCGVASLPKPVKPRELLSCLEKLSRTTPDRPEPARPARAGNSTGATRGRILIAEDNPVNQRVAGLQVKTLGFDTDLVANGEEALVAMRSGAYTLVLMDCQMPGMDGLEATRALRKREGDGSRTPVIALTANAFASDREACLDAGMDGFLSKPVSLRELAALLEQWAPPCDPTEPPVQCLREA